MYGSIYARAIWVKLEYAANELRDVVNPVKVQRARTKGDLNSEEKALNDQRQKTKRPVVFVGSSSESLSIAKFIQLNLEHTCDCIIWSQGVFGLSECTLGSLVRATTSFDFAVLVLTPDDLVTKRGQRGSQPRDNLLFELGLFMGQLGINRTFIVHERGIELQLPSDLAGITPATFAQRDDGNIRAALGSVCTLLEEAFRRVGGARAP